ncbi:3-hydroxyisobutyrate dehydrogenase [Loktanella fryxellensis]|uniref:3-hydroxyisobutyrate dehydrogenase n=2 Tax=Loktanella fryxellensis TaxID=245187 RepID=A0A1H8IXC0_9RHOB|nr:3-hydroxyisobutyrate dehydrogenase [Loktanella fryxellensis]
MGTAYATRLVDCGHAVHVWNRTADGMTAARAVGARAVDDPRTLVARCDIILSSVTDFAALSAILDADGVLSDAAGKLFIEMSTILPGEQQQVAARVVAAGADYLECPVGGTVGPALKGQLLGFAGGDVAAWTRARPVLEQLCRRVDHLGPVGAGARMKLAVNLPLALYWATLGEALSLVDTSAIGADRIVSLIAESSAGPNVMTSRGTVVTAALEGDLQDGTFDLNGLRKDLALALTLARLDGVALPLSDATLARYDAALSQDMGQRDGASLTALIAGQRSS